jgi:NADH-ubiquinone oxidoreductase chain 2
LFESRYLYIVLFSIVYLILSIAFTAVKNNTIIYSRICQLIVAFSIYLLYKLFFFSTIKNTITLFNGTISYDIYSEIFSLFTLVIIFFILFLTSFYPIIIYMIGVNKSLKFIILSKFFEQFNITEYCLLLLFIVSGGLFLMLNNDIINLFLAIELQSYGLYLISTIYKDSENSTKAGLTYFLLGGLSSCIILLGLSLFYINLGNTSMENIYIIYDLSSQSLNLNGYYYLNNNFRYIDITLILVSIGLLFKISGAPFHFWSPDVYDNVPTIITTSIAILAKISILVVILEFSLYLNNIELGSNWMNNILISSMLSLVIGSVLGLSQSRIKRLFAYSTISHLGFLLLALSVNTLESIQAFVFYLMQYSLSNLGAFIILLSIGHVLMNYTSESENIKSIKDKNNSPIQLISQLKGLFVINPILAISLSVVIFSFLGVPPLVGFFGKQMILSASLDKGYVFMSIVGILTSVIGGVYYLAINKNIFIDESIYTSEEGVLQNKHSISLSNALSIIISTIILIMIVFMFVPSVNLHLFNLTTLEHIF